MPTRGQTGRQLAVHVPAVAARRPKEDRMRAVSPYARAHLRRGQVHTRTLEPDGDVIVVGAREFTLMCSGVFDRGEIGRGLPGVAYLRPLTVTGYMRTVIQHAFQTRAGETRAAAHRQQTGDIRPYPVIELSA